MLHHSEKQVNALQKFEFQNSAEIRVNIINGEPWFVAQDVCHTLGVQNNRVTMTQLDDDERLMYAVHTLGQNRHMWHTSESGLYAIIFQSRKPIAKQFRRWVTSEVLPAIRKTGVYAAPKASRELPEKYEALKKSLVKAESEASMWRQISEIYKGISLRCEESNRRIAKHHDDLLESYLSMGELYRTTVNEQLGKLVKEYNLKP